MKAIIIFLILAITYTNALFSGQVCYKDSDVCDNECRARYGITCLRISGYIPCCMKFDDGDYKYLGDHNIGQSNIEGEEEGGEYWEAANGISIKAHLKTFLGFSSRVFSVLYIRLNNLLIAQFCKRAQK